MIQALLEIIFMLSVTAFLAYKAGRLTEKRQTRKLREACRQQTLKIEELQFDLNYCTQIRRRVQRQMRELQKQTANEQDVPQVSVNAQGRIQTGQQRAPAPGSVRQNGSN